MWARSQCAQASGTVDVRAIDRPGGYLAPAVVDDVVQYSLVSYLYDDEPCNLIAWGCCADDASEGPTDGQVEVPCLRQAAAGLSWSWHCTPKLFFQGPFF